MTNPINIFDGNLIRQHRARTAAAFSCHAVLHDESAALLLERVQDVKRTFSHALVLETRSAVERKLQELGMKTSAMEVPVNEILPIVPSSFDLVVSGLALHWINDLPGMLVQIRQALTPDGLFLASLFGGQTLYELRHCLMDAELRVTGGVSPRVSPMVDRSSASALMQRAGFALPVVDSETIKIIYPNMMALMHDVRGMGETNAQYERLKTFTRRQIFKETEQLYQSRYPAHSQGIEASFELVFLHGWRA